MSAFLAILEPTGVVVGILLARLALQIEAHGDGESRRYGWLKPVLHEAITGKGSIFSWALVIGYISGQMGLVAGQRLAEVKTVGAFLVGFASRCRLLMDSSEF